MEASDATLDHFRTVSHEVFSETGGMKEGPMIHALYTGVLFALPS